MDGIHKFRIWDLDKREYLSEEKVYKQIENLARWNPELSDFLRVEKYSGINDCDTGEEIYERDIVEVVSDVDENGLEIIGAVRLLGWKDVSNLFPGGEELPGWYLYSMDKLKKIKRGWKLSKIGNVHTSKWYIGYISCEKFYLMYKDRV